MMKKLHIQKDGRWLPVFSSLAGEVITCEKAPEKALPANPLWAEADLRAYKEKFPAEEFSLIDLTGK